MNKPFTPDNQSRERLAFTPRPPPVSATKYRRLSSGALIRISPVRPWRGKSERRRVIKARREDRLLAAQNG